MGTEITDIVGVKGVAKVVDNVINKLSLAVNWYFTRETNEDKAAEEYIEEIKKSQLTPLQKAAFISNAKKIIKEYSNQCDIVSKAIEMMGDTEHVYDVDNDWLLEFMDKIKNVSSEEFQMILGKILAGEFENPGSYSIRTLNTLRQLNKYDAECFMKVASLAICYSGNYAIPENKEHLKRYGVAYKDLLHLEECGLIKSQLLGMKLYFKGTNRECVLHNNKILGLVKSNDENSDFFEVGIYAFSKCGEELLTAIDVENNEESFLDMLNSLKNEKQNILVSAHKIVGDTRAKEIRYSLEDLLV